MNHLDNIQYGCGKLKLKETGSLTAKQYNDLNLHSGTKSYYNILGEIFDKTFLILYIAGLSIKEDTGPLKHNLNFKQGFILLSKRGQNEELSQ